MSDLLACQHHREGSGRSVGFAARSALWAAADTGALHLWDGPELVRSVALPGYLRGNVIFSGDGRTVRAGRWTVQASSGVAVALEGDPELLVTDLDPPASTYPDRFSEADVVWAPSGDRAAVVTQYRAPRGLADPDLDRDPPGRVLLVDGDFGRVVAVLCPAVGPLDVPVLAASGRHVALATEALQVFDVASGDRQAEPSVDDAAVQNWIAVAFDRAGTRLASVRDDGLVAVWSADSWQQVAAWSVRAPAAGAVAFSPDGELVATAADAAAVVVSTPDGREVASATIAGEIAGLAWGPAGRLYVSSLPPEPSIDVFEWHP